MNNDDDEWALRAMEVTLRQQKKKKVEHWDGVRNYQAANYMKQMND